MKTFSREITNTLVFTTQEVDGHTVLSARWDTQKPKDAKLYIVTSGTAEKMAKRMRAPEDGKNSTISVNVRGDKQIAHPYVVRGLNDYSDLRQHMDSFLTGDDYRAGIPDGCRVVYYNNYNMTFYDHNGNLLNEMYRDTVTAGRYDLAALKELACENDWIRLHDEYDWDEINNYASPYYVPGNGYTMNVSFLLSPDEYQAAVIECEPWERVDRILSLKGLSPEVFAAKGSQEEPDEYLGL